MFITLSVLAALISGMFVASVAFAIAGLQREDEDLKRLSNRHRVF
jgi:hypothetical protein